MKNKKLSIIIRIIVIIIFSILLLIFQNYHEPWADEAQSFLIARDTNLIEMFKYMKYEGTPPLWVIIIKIFIKLGGTYSTFSLVPIFFSILGVIVFEFKIKAPIYIKILFPFTYFIFCQYTIIARSYCLIFLALMIIASIYPKRFEKLLEFTLSLIFLMLISTHSYIIAGSLYLLFLIDLFKNGKILEKKFFIYTIILFTSFFIVLIISLPVVDCYYGVRAQESFSYIIASSTLASSRNNIINIIITIIVISSVFISIKKENILELLIVFLPLLFFLRFFHCIDWHIGIVTYLIVFYLIISDLINEKRIIKIFLVIMCIIQIIWTVYFLIYDVNYAYSAGEKTAQFIIDNNLENKRIYGLGYNVTAIQPYFEKNIFESQYPKDKSFWNWSRKTSPYFLSTEEIINADADVYIISDFYELKYKDVIEYLDNSSNYKKTYIYGVSFMKTYLHESGSYYIYIKNTY